MRPQKDKQNKAARISSTSRRILYHIAPSPRVSNLHLQLHLVSAIASANCCADDPPISLISKHLHNQAKASNTLACTSYTVPKYCIQNLHKYKLSSMHLRRLVLVPPYDRPCPLPELSPLYAPHVPPEPTLFESRNRFHARSLSHSPSPPQTHEMTNPMLIPLMVRHSRQTRPNTPRCYCRQFNISPTHPSQEVPRQPAVQIPEFDSTFDRNAPCTL